MRSVFDIAGSGLAVAGLRLQAAAHNVANLNTEGYRSIRVRARALPEGGVLPEVVRNEDVGVDLSREAVELISARIETKAAVNVIRREDERLGDLLDIFG